MEQDIGVPGALVQALRLLGEQATPERLDRLWIFPPLVKGRSESGVIAAGCFTEGDRRLLVTLAYRAEETGKGVSFRPHFQEEGEAPEDRLPGIMEGVVRRSQEGLGAPRSIPVAGDPSAFQAILDEIAARAAPEHRERSFGSTGETPR